MAVECSKQDTRTPVDFGRRLSGKVSNTDPSYTLLMTTPPGLYSTYTATNHEIKTHARFAHFDERVTPVKVYVFNAKSYTIEGVQVTPIKEREKQLPDHNHVAEYIGPTTTNEISATDAVFYHFDEFDDLCKRERVPSPEYENARENGDLPKLPSFVRYYILSELHELCHWAVYADEQPTGPEHSEIWNTILTGEIEYTTDIPTTDPDFNYEFTTQEDTPVPVPDLDMESLPEPQHIRQKRLSELSNNQGHGS